MDEDACARRLAAGAPVSVPLTFSRDEPPLAWLRVVPSSLPLDDWAGFRVPFIARPWRAMRNRMTGADRWQLARATNTAGTEFERVSTHPTKNDAVAAALALRAELEQGG